ncbi:MAG: hypothetical protein LAO78_10220 [Acidobacteriia bacterium]|nr:hypothetical protein [Terriglobia bacterium]
MTSLTYLRAEEQAGSGIAIQPDPLLGTWLNTNTDTRSIASAVLERKGNQTVVRIVPAGNSKCDWGETAARLFTDSTSSSEAIAFSAVYDFGFMETSIQAHMRQGVLIIARFDRFKDNSGRSNCFSKEFLYREEP